MCLQDVRIGRALATKPGTTLVNPGAAGAATLAGNGNRRTVVVTALFGAAATAADAVMVRAGGSAGPCLAVLVPGLPSATLIADDLGTGVLDQIYITQPSGAGVTVWSAESYFTGGFDDL